MNFSSLLLEFLKRNSTATIIGFGTFYLNHINAELDKDGKSILPPGAKVAFKTEVSADESDLSQFISERKNITLIDAQIEVRKQVNYWNSTLYKEGQLHLESLGDFYLNDHKIHFTSLRTENISPDFYGLEEIKLSEINNKPNQSKAFQLNKSIFWTATLVIFIAGISYLGVTQPEVIFGKRSFRKETPKKNIALIKKDSLQKDSLNTEKIRIDSLKNDSLQNSLAPPVNKWSSKNNSKNKWKNPKKRPNR